MKKQSDSTLGKEYIKAVYCHPAYLTSVQSTSCKIPSWMLQAGSNIARRNINNIRHADDSTLTADIKEELKSLLVRVKEENEKASLKLNFQKTKIMASGPLTSWQIDGKNKRFYFTGLQNHCRW